MYYSAIEDVKMNFNIDLLTSCQKSDWKFINNSCTCTLVHVCFNDFQKILIVFTYILISVVNVNNN